LACSASPALCYRPHLARRCVSSQVSHYSLSGSVKLRSTY
jgi:hypothetical protein